MSDSKPPLLPKRRQFCAGGVSLAALGSLGLTGCGGGSVDDAGSSIKVTESKRSNTIGPAAPRRFVHPGLLHTAADFERMRAKVAANAEPWTSGWKALLTSGRSQLNSMPRPLETVIRGGAGQTFAQMYIDIARAYQLALRWKVSGDDACAERAIAFLNAWSATLTTISGNADRFLAAGIYGYQFANAAEIMRTYAGWAPADLARFQHMMLTVFYPLNHQFLVQHNGAEITNYWAAWDQCTLASILAIGVLCDREDLYNEALNYYMTGPGNGASSQAVYYVHPGHLGQWQESGRDQGHATLGIGLAGAFCEMAWNQGDDMYGYDNNRFLAGAEYVARSNLRDAAGAFYPVPYTPYQNINAFQGAFSPAAQGILRPVWDMVHQHYVNRRGPGGSLDRRASAANPSRRRWRQRRPARFRHPDIHARFPDRQRPERPDGASERGQGRSQLVGLRPGQQLHGQARHGFGRPIQDPGQRRRRPAQLHGHQHARRRLLLRGERACRRQGKRPVGRRAHHRGTGAAHAAEDGRRVRHGRGGTPAATATPAPWPGAPPGAPAAPAAQSPSTARAAMSACPATSLRTWPTSPWPPGCT